MANATTPVIQINEGKVGVGNTIPQTKLEVTSAIPSGNRTVPLDILTITGEGPSVLPYTGSGGAIVFKNTTYTYGLLKSARIRSYIDADSASNRGAGLVFEVTNSNQTYDPSLFLKYNGNVGIGTTSPVPKLHLKYSSGSYGSDATSGFINQATSGRATMRLRSAADAGAELFFDINGGIRWDISARPSSQSHSLNFYPAAATPSYTGVAAHIFELQQNGNVIVTGSGSEGKMGINLTSPDEKLDVDGTIKARQGIYSNFGTYTGGGTYTNHWQKFATAGYSAFSYSGFKIIVQIIGDTSNINANAEIDINWKFQNNNGKIFANITNYGASKLTADNFEIYRNGTTNTLTFYHRVVRNYSNPIYSMIGSSSPSIINFVTSVIGTSLSGETNDAWTEKVIINSLTVEVDTGNIGIGTTVPANKLNVVEGTSNWEVAEFQSSSTTGAGITLIPANISSLQWSIIGQGTGGGANDNNLGFHLTGVGTSGGSAGYKMTLQASSGNVGIGENNPQQKLHVDGRGLFETGGSVPDSTTGTYEKGITLTGGNQRLVIDVSSVSNGGSYIQTRHQSTSFPTAEYSLALNPLGGNVGVGVTGPAEKLEVAGSIKSTSRAISGSATAGVTLSYDTTNSIAKIETWTSKPFSIETAGLERMRVVSGGNVGIHETDPQAKLHITNEGQGQFVGPNNSNAGGSHLILEDKGGTTRTLMSGPSIVFKTPASIGNVWATSRLLASPSAGGSARGTFSIQVRDIYDLTGVGSNSWNWRTALTVIESGNVGIGTTSPDTRLELEGAAALLKLSSDTATGNPYLEFAQTGTRRSYIQHLDSGDNLLLASEYGGIKFYTGTNGVETEKMVILADGSVGVGVVQPVNKLQVGGKIYSSTDIQAASQVQAATYRWSATTTPLEQSGALTSSEPANPPDFTPDGYIEIKVQTTVYLIPIFEKQT